MIDQFDILVTENNDNVTVNVTNNLEEVVDIFVAEDSEEIELNITNNIVELNIIRGAVNLSLTTNNNSGPATYDNITGVFNIPNYTLAGLGGQAALNGLGFVKINGTTISYDNSTYLTTINGIAAGGELSGTYPNPTLVNSAVTGKLLSGVNITGGTIQATDSILTAFGKVQNQINGLIGGTIFQGLWNASTNSPSLASSVGSNGHYYIVSVAGSTNLNGITDWNVGDWAIFSGTSWQKVDNTDAVVSVNGFTGAVSLTTSNITEGTNLYYTDARVNANANVAANTAARHAAVTLGTANGLSLSGQQLSLGLASGSANGALSSTDWTTFNNKQNALTNPITGTGTTNFLPKFTGGSTLGNSIVSESGTSISVAGNLNTTGNGTTSALLTNNNGSGAQHYQVFGNGAGFVSGRILRGNGASGLEANGLNIDSFEGFKVRLNQLGGSGGSFTIDGGNLGLGVTPSAWRSAEKAIQIGSYTILSDISRYSGFGNNYYTNSSNQNIYLNTDGASLYQQFNGSHYWYNAPSGTAGNAISFTQAMTLDASGRLGIGTTSPLARLHVVSVNGAAGNTLPTNATAIFDQAGNNLISISGGSTDEAGVFMPRATSAYYSGVARLDTNLIFRNNDAERMRITSGGNVGIGTTSPVVSLHIENTNTSTSPFGNVISTFRSQASGRDINLQFSDGATQAYIGSISGSLYFGTAGSNERMRITSGGAIAYRGESNVNSQVFLSNDNSLFRLYAGDSSASTKGFAFFVTNGSNQFEAMRITSSGNVGIGTTSPSERLTVSGNVLATAFFTSSDITLKNIIKTNYNPTGIEAISYKWKDSGIDTKVHTGYSAQQVQEFMPDAVSKDSNGKLSVNYVEVLVAKIAVLEAKVKQLEAN
jgi:hypothetical protein